LGCRSERHRPSGRRALIALLLFSSLPLTAKPLHHYVFFNRERAAIRNPALEPSKDQYEFTAIRDDLAFLRFSDANFGQRDDLSAVPCA
jgi:hypothetical protein